QDLGLGARRGASQLQRVETRQTIAEQQHIAMRYLVERVTDAAGGPYDVNVSLMAQQSRQQAASQAHAVADEDSNHVRHTSKGNRVYHHIFDGASPWGLSLPTPFFFAHFRAFRTRLATPRGRIRGFVSRISGDDPVGQSAKICHY